MRGLSDGVNEGSVAIDKTSSPLYLLLNLTQGVYGGPTLTPATMRVDYVRVWQKA